MAFEGVSVALAMYALIQFYFQTKEELKEKRPFMKLLCIKLVIFFCFWQTVSYSPLDLAFETLPRSTQICIRI